MTNFLNTVFPVVLNMSFTAIPVILTVLLARLLLRRAPKCFSYLLWAVVLFRLLCPVSLTADFSLLRAVDAPVVPATAVVSTVEYVQPALPIASEPVTPDISETTVPNAPAVSDEKSRTAEAVLPWIWLAGVLGMAVYSGVSLFRLRRKLIGSVRLRKNIDLSDHVETAFVTGILRPRIYLPSNIGESEQQYILLHEQHHIRRGDPVWKLLAFLALSIHWFHPLVWLSFVLASRDMEMSCDEAVVRKLGTGIRADYSQSLLNLAAGRHLVTAPLAFCEGDTRSRIINVLNWKRPRACAVLLAAVICIAVTAACGVNPVRSSEGPYGSMEDYVSETLADLPETLTLPYCPDSGDPQDVTLKTRGAKIETLRAEGEQADLDPKGTLTVWRYSYSIQTDLNGYSPDWFSVGGSEMDDAGFYHGDNQHIAVTRTLPDGRLEVLSDETDIDSSDFLYYNTSWDDALYDWYVKEQHLETELPLLVKDWKEQVTLPEDASLSDYPVCRTDGDGWYFYMPIQAWEITESNETKLRLESSYGTGSMLVVDAFTQSVHDEQDICKKQGFTPAEGSQSGENWYIWESPRSPEGIGRYYFFDRPDGGSWRVWIQWNPEAIEAHWSPYPKMEPQVLLRMAESFTVDARMHFSPNAEPVQTPDAET